MPPPKYSPQAVLTNGSPGAELYGAGSPANMLYSSTPGSKRQLDGYDAWNADYVEAQRILDDDPLLEILRWIGELDKKLSGTNGNQVNKKNKK